MNPWSRHVPSSGSTGTGWGLVLRSFQLLLSLISFVLIIIRPDFYHYTSFRFLWVAMSFVITWSIVLVAWESSYSCYRRQPLFQMEILMIAISDWIFSLLTLAAGCAGAGVTSELLRHKEFCRHGFCVLSQTSASLAIINWFLIVVSALLNIRSLKVPPAQP